jgi:hypothetical protein
LKAQKKEAIDMITTILLTALSAAAGILAQIIINNK